MKCQEILRFSDDKGHIKIPVVNINPELFDISHRTLYLILLLIILYAFQFFYFKTNHFPILDIPHLNLVCNNSLLSKCLTNRLNKLNDLFSLIPEQDRNPNACDIALQIAVQDQKIFLILYIKNKLKAKAAEIVPL